MKLLLENWRQYMNEVVVPPSGFLEGSVIKDTLYHASDYKMEAGDKLDPRNGGEFGIYLSPNRKYARRYGNYLYYVLANIKNPKVVEGKYEISPKDLTEEDVSKLKEEGYDGIVVTSGGIGDASEIVAFDPEQVHIMDVR
jgi:hypothetical protein|tara:strand:- start:253 stop:672 length:420 start_codon:yes stop_codon:yes gene_type:complete